MLRRFQKGSVHVKDFMDHANEKTVSLTVVYTFDQKQHSGKRNSVIKLE